MTPIDEARSCFVANHYFMSHKLDNYLRRYRRRVGFSQKEVAFLLGCGAPSKVSRYEQLDRKPGLEAALAYEAVFGVPVRELFAGIYEKVQEKVLKRARVLTRDTGQAKPTCFTPGKVAALRVIAGSRIEDRPKGHEE